MSSSENERTMAADASSEEQQIEPLPRHLREDELLPPEPAQDSPAAEPEVKAPVQEEPQSETPDDHHEHHSHHSHHSHHRRRFRRSRKSKHFHGNMIAIWDEDYEDVQDGAHRSHTKVMEASGADAEPAFVPPVIGNHGAQSGAETQDVQREHTKVMKPSEADAEPACVAPAEEYQRVKPAAEKTDGEAGEQAEYVVPSTVGNGSLFGRRSTTHQGKTRVATEEEIKEAEEGFVFKKPRKKKKHRRRRMRLWLKILIIVVSVLLTIVIALVSTFFILKEIGRRSLHNYDNIDIVSPTTAESGEDVVEVIDKGRSLVYEGRKYHFNEDMVCIAFIGINRDVDDWGNLLQPMADSINMIALDTDTGKLSIIAVSRDTMTDVKVYSAQGSLIDSEITQLSYAYSFDGNGVSGGENTSASLSKLFFGLPVNHYFALNMDALMDLNDAIGGVTLTSSMDFVASIGEVHVGDTITLYGEDVRRYVKTRGWDAEGNNARMKRQQEYIRAFLSQVIPAVKKDLSLVTKLYGIVDANSKSNLDLPKIVYLASELTSKMKSFSDVDFLSIKGESKEGDEHTEFYADDKNVLETMIKVFYLPDEEEQPPAQQPETASQTTP